MSGIGFGCASLGSRKSRAESLASLARAFDAGIRWFDVAPSYGDGEAEKLLGEFLRNRRSSVSLCTKVGILPGPVSLSKRLLRPAVRLVLNAAPSARSAIKRRRPAAVKLAVTPALIARSIDCSLSRLGVERVDVLALHDAAPEEVARDDVLRALETVLSSGKADRIGIASSAEAGTVALGASSLFGLVQVANNPFEPNLAALAPILAANPAIQAVTHSVFGSSGMVEAIAAQIEGDEALLSAMNGAGYKGGARDKALSYLLDYALAANKSGVVLLSMFSPSHLEANLARVAVARDDQEIMRIAALIRRS